MNPFPVKFDSQIQKQSDPMSQRYSVLSSSIKRGILRNGGRGVAEKEVQTVLKLDGFVKITYNSQKKNMSLEYFCEQGEFIVFVY